MTIYRIAFIAFMLMSAAVVRAERETDMPDFYGKDELAPGRALIPGNVTYTGNPAIMSKTAETLLNGPLNVSIKVVDARTSNPLSRYVLHAFYVATGRRIIPQEHHDNVSGVKWAVYYNRELPIGRLESKVVDDAGGRCVYAGVPAGRYWFQIIANGHVRRQASVVVLPGHTDIVLAMEPTGGIRIKFIDAETSRPIPGMLVKLSYPPAHEAMHTVFEDKGYQARTDANGNFSIEDLPDDDYTIGFPEISEQLHEAPSKVNRRVPNPGVYFEYTGDSYFHTMQEYFSSPHYIVPALRASKRGDLDMGSVALTRVPTVEIEIRNADGKPMPFFPYDLMFGAQPFHSTTGRDGRTTVPLVGFVPGVNVTLSAPGALAERYRSSPNPNTVTVQPEPGKFVPLKLIYQPTEFDFDLHLAFRHKTTGKPIEYVSGAITSDRNTMEAVVNGLFHAAETWDQGNARLFEARGGKTTVPHYTLTTGLIDDEKKAAEADRKNPNNSKDDYTHKQLRLMIYVRAPGCAPQVFRMPLADVRAGREFVCEMEPGSTVRGRLMITDEMAFTSETVKRLLVKDAQWNDKSRQALDYKFRENIFIRFENMAVDGDVTLSDLTQFTHWALVPIQADGSFCTRELRATKNWSMVVQTDFWPPYARRALEIKPGDNDLGDIYLAKTPGQLDFQVRDEQGRPIQGARIDFPLENAAYRWGMREKIFTDANGRTRFNLSFLQSGTRQLIHLCPPWGFDKDPRQDTDVGSSIIYDRLIELSKDEDHILTATIERGHTLKLRVDPTSEGAELARFYGDTKNWKVDSDIRRKRRPYFAIGGFALESLVAAEKEFRYHQARTIAGGLNLTSGTQEFVIRNVPPGRTGVRVDGGFYEPLIGQKSPVEPNGTVPIGYIEFDMPAHDSEIEMALNDADITVELDGVTPELVKQEKAGFMLFLERDQPISTVFGSDAHRRFAGVLGPTGKDVDRQKISFIGFVDEFLTYGSSGDLIYRPARFMAVPQGRYILRAYKGFTSMFGPEPKPVWDQTVDVTANAGEMKMRMPFK